MKAAISTQLSVLAECRPLIAYSLKGEKNV